MLNKKAKLSIIFHDQVFPWDYKTAELPGYGWNISTAVIDFFAWLGWATELKTVPDDVILKRVLRTGEHFSFIGNFYKLSSVLPGDGSHPYSKLQQILEERKKSGGINALGELRDTEHFWGFVSALKNIQILCLILISSFRAIKR